MASDSNPRITLYFDGCCLNRPFDDQSQVRSRLEAEAVLLIVFQVHISGWEWIGSEVLSYEIDQTPDPDRRLRVKSLMTGSGHRVQLEPAMMPRAEGLQRLGFKAYDALHIVCAERGGTDILLTTDDRFARLADRNADKLHLRVSNPLKWIEETFA